MPKPRESSVTDETCKCGYLENAANDPRMPIVFDASLSEYSFEFPSPCENDGCESDKASLIIYHCPFCGGAAPKSKRELLFAAVPPEEEERLHQLLCNLESLEEAIRVLGEPDMDMPFGDTVRQPEIDGRAPFSCSMRSLTYSKLSDTADVILTDYPGRGVAFTLVGKYIGPPDSKP